MGPHSKVASPPARQQVVGFPNEVEATGRSDVEFGVQQETDLVFTLGELRELVVRASKEALSQSLLGKACQYALKQWSRLELIMGDGRIEVDNNWVENGMRPIALGRRNWVHIGSEAAGRDVAALASVVETCKRNGICLREYLQSVLPGLNDVLARRAAELTRMAWYSRHVEK